MEHLPLELVRRTARYLGDRGFESPRLDAEVLLAHVLGVTRIQLYLQFDRPLASAEVDAYREAVRRRARREPVAHITGVREFWSLPFLVDGRVLVPRPETETLVAAALGRMGEAGRLADLGTGSGAVAVALLRERPGWSGVGVDLSESALEVAQANVAHSGLGPRLDLRSGDLFEPLAGDLFDAVVSNPPYIPSAEIPGLEAEVAIFDPRLALDGGDDGLGVIRRIVEQAPAHLAGGGFLALEFGTGQEGEVIGLIQGEGSYEEPAIVLDPAGRPRVALAVRRGT
ncbi:MAG: peptide chain release factor N(5)-glutamine methyltransferase [Deferrisomatales bacterium]